MIFLSGLSLILATVLITYWLDDLSISDRTYEYLYVWLVQAPVGIGLLMCLYSIGEFILRRFP